jgi:hypothetical protein
MRKNEDKLNNELKQIDNKIQEYITEAETKVREKKKFKIKVLKCEID